MNDIVQFIENHHILNLSSCENNIPHTASCFYAFSSSNFRFIIASDDSSRHIKELSQNPNYSATISSQTKQIGEIQGLQLSGTFKKATLKEKAIYIKTFPYALALNPAIYSLHIKTLKFINNQLNFGEKKIYSRENEDANLNQQKNKLSECL